MTQARIVRTAVRGVSVLLLALAVGCGGGGPLVVSGKVKYKGQPLTVGTIEFHGPGGKVRASSISPDGSFTVMDAPVGESAVAVKVPAPNRNAPPNAPLATAPGVIPVRIPARYADPAKSQVRRNLGPGNSTVDIDLQ